MSSEIDPSTSFRTNESHKLIIKIDKTRRQCTVIYNEGYIEDDERFELESECTFYPVNKQQAASKIQSLWRAHHKKDDILQLLLLCGRFHQYKILKFQQKLDSLEAKIEEEQAMRVAFETAMEDLTEVIDQQQKMLYDRLDQQVHMGRSCESKMKVLAKSLNPLELRLQQETEARKELEVTMGRVLEELEDTKQSIIQSTKQQQQTSSSPKRRNMRSAVPEKRTSVIPSIRRPISNKQQAPARRNANGLKQQS
jgi:hypothetical protein